ncbi:hypothetical protein WJX81_008147 [Elliptochloris bilobata]|uniref:Cytochrome P450 n=1 Tax=Elliptochloris bilobata TaxID=381761 RepID=A0AAW1RIQ9_9CHLO
MIAIYGYRPVQRWTYRSIPGPPPRWLTGNLSEITRLSYAMFYLKYARKYGKVWKVWFGSRVVVLVMDPDLGRLVNRNPNRHAYPHLGDLKSAADNASFFSSITTARDHNLHRSLQSAWQPTLSSASLAGYAPAMNAAAERLVACLGAVAAANGETDMLARFFRVAVDVVGTAVFGVDMHAQDDDDGPAAKRSTALVTAMQTLMDIEYGARSRYLTAGALFPFAFPLLRALVNIFPDNAIRRICSSYVILRGTCEEVLGDIKAKLAAAAPPASPAAALAGAGPLPKAAKPKSSGAGSVAMMPQAAVPDGGDAAQVPTPPGGFIPHLLSSAHHAGVRGGALLSDDEVLQQAMSFLVGTPESTAAAMSFCVHCLASHSAAEAALLQEVDAFGRARVPSAEDLAGLPYLDAVWTEALRLYGPGVSILREAAHDQRIGGHFIPKGTALQTVICAIHRDPAIWPRAGEFVPERWLAGHAAEVTDAQRRAFNPWGDGARACIGRRFAAEEGRIVLLRLYQQFTFELLPGQVPLELWSPFSIKPRHGLFVRPRVRA